VVPADGTFLGALPEAEADALLAQGRRKRYPKGSTLFLEGEVAGNVIVVIRGRVKISYATDDGQDVMLAVREAGDVLGELSAIDGEPRSAAATALEPIEAVVIDADRFKAFLRSYPDAGLTLLRHVSRRLRDADRKRIEFGSSDTVGRVAGRLLELADRFGHAEGEGTRVDLPVTQEELASWVGASRKAVTNALQHLRARGLIATGRKSVLILDIIALRKRAT